jgi:hypothetical protein
MLRGGGWGGKRVRGGGEGACIPREWVKGDDNTRYRSPHKKRTPEHRCSEAMQNDRYADQVVLALQTSPRTLPPTPSSVT